MFITLYAGAKCPEPAAAEDLPWETIAAELAALANEPTKAPATADRETQKRALTAWSPHRLRVPHRLAKNVDVVTMLALDVDAGARPEDVAAHLASAGVAGLVYESPSSTMGAPKFRVACPLEREIAPAECGPLRLAFAEWLGLVPMYDGVPCGPQACLDPSRIFFAGRLHGTPERRTWITEGAALPADGWPALRHMWSAAPVRDKSAAPPIDLSSIVPTGIAESLGPWTAYPGKKWQICGALGGLMRKMLYTAAQAENEIRRWLPADEPTVDVEAGVSWALGAWQKDIADVSGHDALTTLLGPEHTAIVESAAQAGTWWYRAPEVATRSPFAPEGGDPFADDALITDFEGDDEPLAYLCAGLCIVHLEGKINVVGGLPNAGKGPLADYLAICFATGRQAFGRFPCTRLNVLVVDFEGARLTKRRIKRMAKALGIPWAELRDRIVLVNASSLGDPRHPQTLERLHALIQRRQIGLVVVDSYTSAMLCTDVDSKDNAFATYARTLASLGVCVVAVAHARKPTAGSKGEMPTLADISGSGALGAMASTAISCWKPDDADPYRVRVGCMRAPERGFEQFDIVFTDTADDGLALEHHGAEAIAAAEETAKLDDVTQRARLVLAELRRLAVSVPQKDIAATDSKGDLISGNLLVAALGMLERAGLVSRQSGHPTRYQVVSVHDTRDVRVVGGRVVVG